MSHHRITRLALLAFSFCLLLPPSADSRPPETQPVAGLRENTPAAWALTGGRVVVAPGRVLEPATVVLRDGVITNVGTEVAAPGDARTIDMTGKTIYAGLIDAFSEQAVEAGSADAGASYWNEQVRPELDVASRYKADAKLNETLRGQGITVRLVAPQSRIIKGISALVTTGDAPPHRSILQPDVAQHVRLTVSRSRGRGSYPNSPMGAVALARQAMYDADWYRRAWQAHRTGSELPRPEYSETLESLQRYQGGDSLVVFDAINELYFLRADRFAREFSLNAAMRGSGNEYRRLDAIRDTGRPVLVPVNFPKPPNVATPEVALNVPLEQLMHWDLAPENPARLARAGISIAFTSHGLDDRKTFLKNVRQAVERGLPAEEALRALTTTPADLFGASDRLGTVEAGKMANLVITDGDLFAAKTKVLETWVDGRRFEHEPQQRLDLTGTWRLTVTDPDRRQRRLLITLKGKPEKLSGEVRMEPSASGEEQEGEKPTKLKNVGLRDGRFSATFDASPFGHEGIAQLTAVVTGEAEESPQWLGHILWPDGSRSQLTAERVAQEEAAEKETTKEETNEEPSESAGEEGEEDDEEKDDEEKDEEVKKSLPSSFEVNYPLGAFGRSEAPEQPALVALRGATIWTAGPEGTLENATLLLGAGKIIAVGTDIEIPKDAVVIDVRGKHVTPGIIDCHSHMATDGGINESTQAITAEVRIGDFIDADDINIYRQLAGGVTSSNILHGSANPIGGQNQVIKLRWGALSEEMKFEAAPPGIKFALGENVKQSNWGDDYNTRYPQTRMGVEQIIRDAFQAAKQYRQRWEEWQRDHQGLPPRHDLELEALSEILQGERWVHCHSYRQDEILALIRTLDDFGVRIGTFQHILEGYKVADAMARHGAMGSAFSDWWAYKFEVYDAIPYNGALMHEAGVVVSFNSDDRELARHLNQEAAKAVKYGGVPPEEALKFVTLNPARQLRIEQHVGSLEPGKNADLVVWSGSPLSILARCEQTWIDGRKYFDLEEDKQARERAAQMRNTLVQKILASGQPMRKPGESDNPEEELWPREDLFCHHHDDDHEDHQHEQDH